VVLALSQNDSQTDFIIFSLLKTKQLLFETFFSNVSFLYFI